MTSNLDRHRERFRADPGDLRSFQALEEHLFLAGAWDELVELYRLRLSAPDLAERPADRAQVWLRLGQVWEERRGEPDRAIGAYREALAADPRCRPALTQLRRLHVQREQWDVALQISELEIELPMSRDELAALATELGGIWLDRLGDPEQALIQFERAIAEHPHWRAAHEGLARAHEVAGRPRQAAEAWARAAQALRGPARARALIAQARLLAGPLESPQAAIELYRKALTEDPHDPDALDAVARDAANHGRWALVADLGERRFEQLDDPPQRVASALELARVHAERLDNPAAAHAWLERALELAPRNAAVHAARVELARASGDEAALLESLAELAELDAEHTPVSTWMQLASLHSDRGDDEPARLCLERALERAPSDALVLEALADTLLRLGQSDRLADVLERRAELAGSDGPGRAAVLAELAQHQAERLGDAEAARHSLERAFEADPSSSGVAAALCQSLRKAELWEPLDAHLERAGRDGPPDERAGFLCALGTLRVERGDREGAARALERALALDPRNELAHRALQSLARATGDEEAVLRACQREAEVTADGARLAGLVREIAPRLEERDRADEALAWVERWVAAAPEDPDALRECVRLCERPGRDAEQAEALRRLDPLLPRHEQAALRRRLGALHAEHGRLEPALEAYRRALEADPGDADALAARAGLLEGAGRLAEAAEARRALVGRLEPPARAQCLDALATLLEKGLGDAGGAIASLERLEREPGAPDGVAARLETLLERAERYVELEARLRARADAPGCAPDERFSLELRRARLLLDALARPDESAAAFRELCRLDPDSEPARAGLEAALRAAGDPAPLAELLAERAESAPDAGAREAAALERAALLEGPLDDPQPARETYARLAAGAADPARRAEAARRLEALLERTRAWGALREHWEAGLEAEDDVARRERLGRLCRDRLADPGGAAQHFEAAARLAPDRAEPWRALAGLYAESGDETDLVRVLEAELETQPDPERELPLRARAGHLCADSLMDAERARRHFERVLELDPAHAAAAEFMIGHWERDGRPEATLRLLEVRLASLEREGAAEASGATRTSLRLRIAGLRAATLEDLDGAIAALEPALEEVGAEPAVAEPLADLYQRAGRDEALLELCRSAAERCDDGERANWFLRLADAQRRRGDDRAAVEAFRDVLCERPDDREAQAALRDLYRRLAALEPLAGLLEAELSHRSGADEIPLRMELAGILAGPLRRPAEALVNLRRVLQIEPDHAEALERALELAEGPAGGGPEGAAAVRLELLDAALSPSRPASARAALLARRARALRELGRPDEAIEALDSALALDASLRDERRELRELLEARGSWEPALERLFAEALDADAATRAGLLERAAEIAATHLAPERALAWLERLRGERPRDAAILARVAELHRHAGRSEALLRSFDALVEACDGSPARRRAFELERARVLENELGSPARAAAALEAARAALPGEVEILDRLDRLYRELRRPAERASVLEELVGVATDDSRVARRGDLGALYGGPLGDPARAAEQLLVAVSLTPRAGPLRAELLRALGDALRDAGPPEAWARCAEAELAALDPEAPVFRERRRELQRALAGVYERALMRPDAALRHLRALADAEAPDEPEAAERTAIEDALLRLLRREDGWVELERRLAARLERHPDDAAGWLELARLRAERLRAPAAAAEAYRRLLDQQPDDVEALRGLRHAAEQLGDWEQVARTLDRELEHAEARAATAALARRLGDVCWQRLESTTRASRAYAVALEADPHDFASLRALERLLEAMEDWRGALDLYESEIEVLGEDEPERRFAVWLRVAELARARSDEPERALRALERAMRIAPLPGPQLAELARLRDGLGDRAGFAEALGAWCDAPDVQPDAGDWVRLGETLEALGRAPQALERVEQALAADPEHAQAWELAARLREVAGHADEAARALERAAELGAPGERAGRLLRAARLVESQDPERAETLLRAGLRADPSSAALCAALARVSARLGDLEQAEEMAGRALDAAPARADDRLETALVGARAARARGRYEPAARLYAAALEADPDHREALAEQGESLIALGDLAGARRVLEARLALDASYPDRDLHLTRVGAALEAEGALDAARERYEQAIEASAARDEAHAGLVRLHEAAGRVDEGVACWVRWAEAAQAAQARAERLLRAAEWELREGGRSASAERHLREALEASPRLDAAWVALATLLWDEERADDALEVAGLGLDAVTDDAARGALAEIRGRALELRGERAEAAAAFRTAAVADPHRLEAALSSARLLRGLGEWRAAADALADFSDRHPGDDASGLARVLQQLGRLRAGPLEDVEGAIAAYRRAISIDPDRIETRVALAELLGHRSGDWDAAVEQHRRVLAADPTHAASLRKLLHIARGRDDADAVACGLHLLAALGVATPAELEEAETAPRPRLAGEPELADPLFEKLRRLALEAAHEIGGALQASEPSSEPSPDGADDALRAAARAAERRLTAPALLPLPPSEVREVLALVATLALAPDAVRGDGHLVNALSAALGRRSLRRLRRILDGADRAEIERVDFGAWRTELRALAAAVALDETGGDLRDGLTMLLAESSDRPPSEIPRRSDLSPYVAACPEAGALLRLAIAGWLKRF